jgi:ornithine cyclodeaminase/alanine dehydrogenase-like protein (mu-crystallin family)
VRRDEVVADLELMRQELLRDDRADRVAPDILRPTRAAAVAIEAGHRIGAAGFEQPAENVALVSHSTIMVMSDGVLVVTGAQVRELLSLDELAEALRTAFRAVSDGSASVPPRVAAHTTGGLLGTMPGYVPGLGLGAKLVTYFRGNHERGVPGHQALVALFDPDDGRPLALLDGTEITAVRTAMSAAVAARELAPSPTTVTVIGSGVQARSHLDAFAWAFPQASMRLAGRTPAHVQAVATAHPGAVVVDDVRAAADGADVICLTTDADQPILAFGDLPPGCHVSSVGSGVEVDAPTVAAARVFVESRVAATQPFPAGSRELADREPDSVTEIGEVLLGTKPGRQSDDDLTLWKSMGHATEDLAAAVVVHRAAIAAGIGARVTF